MGYLIAVNLRAQWIIRFAFVVGRIIGTYKTSIETDIQIAVTRLDYLASNSGREISSRRFLS